MIKASGCYKDLNCLQFFFTIFHDFLHLMTDAAMSKKNYHKRQSRRQTQECPTTLRQIFEQKRSCFKTTTTNGHSKLAVLHSEGVVNVKGTSH